MIDITKYTTIEKAMERIAALLTREKLSMNVSTLPFVFVEGGGTKEGLTYTVEFYSSRDEIRDENLLGFGSGENFLTAFWEGYFDYSSNREEMLNA